MENNEKKEHSLESVSFISRVQTWYVVFHPMKFQASFSLIRVNVSSSFQAISEENEGNSCVVWAMDVENLTMLNKVNLIVTLPFQARGRGWNVSMLVLNYGFILWSQFLHVLAGSWEEHLPGNLTNVWKLKVAISKGEVLCSLDACWVPQFVSSQLGGVRWHAGSAGWRMRWPLAPLVCDSLVSSRPSSPCLCRLF